MSAPLSQSLERVLQEQLDLYEKYLNLLTQDEDLMARLKIEELEQNNKSKTTIFLKLQTMDEARKNVVRQMAQSMALPEEKVTLEEIARKLSSLQSGRLLELRKKLKEVIARAKEMQVHTSALAQASLTWINGSMRSFQSIMAPAPVYSAQGKVETPENFSGLSVERRA